MTAVLTPPLLVAAGVVCVAGALKLRNPAPAARAASVLGPRAAPNLIRVFAAGELALGAWVLLGAPRAASAAVAALYASFAVVSLLLARRHVACGCFGEDEAPASFVQSLLSVAFAAVALLATMEGAHGFGWVLGYDPARALTLALGIAGALYATVIAYIELPRAWTAWSAR